MSRPLSNIHPEVSDLRNQYIDPNRFPELSLEEIARRKASNLIFTEDEFFETLFTGNTNIDLRHYVYINLGNIIICSVPDGKCLASTRRNSKFAQGNFVLFNLGDQMVSRTPGPAFPDMPVKVAPFILRDREIVINCSGAKRVDGNVKLGPQKIRFTFVLDQIENMQCDIREMASDGQIAQYVIDTRGNQDIAGNWSITLFSAKDANIAGDHSPNDRPEKFTTGIISYVFNGGTKIEAQYNGAPLYYDDSGSKFGQVQFLAEDEKDLLESQRLLKNALKTLEDVKEFSLSPSDEKGQFTKEEFIKICFTLHKFLKEQGHIEFADRLAHSFNQKYLTVTHVVGDQVLTTPLTLPLINPHMNPKSFILEPLLHKDKSKEPRKL